MTCETAQKLMTEGGKSMASSSEQIKPSDISRDQRIDEILRRLSHLKYPAMTFIAREYSIQDLINDLNQTQEINSAARNEASRKLAVECVELGRSLAKSNKPFFECSDEIQALALELVNPKPKSEAA